MSHKSAVDTASRAHDGKHSSAWVPRHRWFLRQYDYPILDGLGTSAFDSAAIFNGYVFAARGTSG
jgi:hypothetical protein